MPKTRPTGLFHRREVLLGTAAAVLGSALPMATAAEAPASPSPAYEAAYKQLVGDAQPEAALISMELPEQAENGNIVPYKLSVESPMTPDDHIRKLHLLSTANPQPRVATFHFTPQSGKAEVTGRMRLAKTQDVVALAETSTGKLLTATVRVEVALGGCTN
ncbi:MAG: thiosulfate oxidation carrier protein SoxY [Hyphomicrobium sp.]